MSGGAVGVLLGFLAAAIAGGALWLRRLISDAESRGAAHAVAELGAQVHRAERAAASAEARAQAAHEARIAAIGRSAAAPTVQTIDDDRRELAAAEAGPGEDVRRAIEGRRGR